MATINLTAAERKIGFFSMDACNEWQRKLRHYKFGFYSVEKVEANDITRFLWKVKLIENILNLG